MKTIVHDILRLPIKDEVEIVLMDYTSHHIYLTKQYKDLKTLIDLGLYLPCHVINFEVTTFSYGDAIIIYI